MENIVEIKNITIDYNLKKYSLRAVSNISMQIKKGYITALVGESGSGKSTLATSLLEVISTPGVIESGEILYLGNQEVKDITKMSENELTAFRWSEISMVFQGAQSALNPIMTIYDQFEETYLVHNRHMKKKEAKKLAKQKTIELLKFVNLDPDRIMQMYPHELSGGMKQRAMIAFSLLLNPKLIILDEPTTALDVIVQGYIFKILKKINIEMGVSMLLLTHDIGVVAEFADYVAVMYGGQLMEYGTTYEVFKERMHPYSNGLIDSTPSLLLDIDAMKPIKGSPPDIRNLPEGCVFHPRCDFCMEKCKTNEPKDYMLNDHTVKCHLLEDLWIT